MKKVVKVALSGLLGSLIVIIGFAGVAVIFWLISLYLEEVVKVMVASMLMLFFVIAVVKLSKKIYKRLWKHS